MSTAGKVLTVLVLLVMIGFVVMLSAVTQLNVNWQQRIAKQDKELEEATTRTVDATKAIIDLTESARAEQTNKDRDLREVEGRILIAERQQSSQREDLSRLQIQLADYLAAVGRAQTNNTTREAEKAKAIDDLAKKRDEIAKSQAVNADLRDQLAKLQDEFKRLLADNASKAEKAAQGGRPAPRSASGRRPAPAS